MSAKHYYLISPSEQGAIAPFVFTYEAPCELRSGQMVKVPFGRRQSLGVVTGPAQKPDFPTKEITEILDLPPLPKRLVELAGWMSEYYAASPSAVWQTLLPAGMTTKRRERLPKTSNGPVQKTDWELTPTQQQAVDRILESQGNTLLLGVTGSGKTQVYIELARKTLAKKQGVIVLTPEISLTPQTVGRFETAFPGQIIATHSAMTPAERHISWLSALKSDQPKVVIGPRSALFSPLPNLGLIVIDECHETSYKQESAPRYWSDTVAAKLAGLSEARLVLGSATPGLTQYFLAERGRLELAELTERISQAEPSVIEVVDLRRKDLLKSGSLLSRPLAAALTGTLAEGRQSLLFINRRGSASSLLCADCGWISLCPRCRLPLTFHADRMELVCHLCDHKERPAAICPECRSANLRYLGGGTKRIEDEVRRLLPSARIARLDRDSLKPGYAEEVYRQLMSGELDILIGTQMIAKGFDLPAIDTVGIVSADTMLHLADYTAAERTYQLLRQVAGRTGRGDRRGKVIIQTFTPDHPTIQAVRSHDFRWFAEQELAERKLLSYPPYVYLLKLVCSAKNQATAERKAHELASRLIQKPDIRILGPAPAFHETAGGIWHWHLIVRSLKRSELINIARDLPGGWTADLDPLNLL